MDAVTSRANPLVKLTHSLRQKKTRDETGLFIVEGIHLVGAAYEAGWEFSSILFAPEMLVSNYANDLLGKLRKEFNENSTGGRQVVQPVSGKILESLAEKENPQGVIAIVRQRKPELARSGGFNFGVAVVSPQDPGNIGTIQRSMDAAGAETLFLLDGGVDLFHPSVVRASMGALFSIPTIQCSFNEFTDWARQAGYFLIGTSAHAGLDYRKLVPAHPWILVFGNEQKGLTVYQQNACDRMIGIPMHGRISSLNLGVAASILLYEFIPQSSME
jgi:TrmH family RNA methyltransferase